MGCGILFPRDYSADTLDSDGSRDSPDVSDDEGNGDDYLEAENYHGAASSDSEDEHWWERPHAHSGTIVQVSADRTQQQKCEVRALGKAWMLE